MRSARGFTLIELMITVAVIAILASIALPSYNDYVIRSKLTEAHTFLSDLRVKMEQRFQDSRAYNSPNSCITPSGSQVKYFTFSCPTLTANQYTLQAAGNAGSDLEGIAFTITESNVRATTVTAGSKMATKGYTSNSTCWVTKKGGIC